MEQNITRDLLDLLEYARHKGGCGLKMVPYESYIDDYGSMQVMGDGISVTNECTCGFSKVLERTKQCITELESQFVCNKADRVNSIV